jgi:gluconate 2-dehydrogenase gamma chain
MDKLTRRSFLTGSLFTGSFVAGSLLSAAPERARASVQDPPRYRFFDADEARFVEAACERLIPADATGPGATAAGVPGYLDSQLAGPWGAGTQPYRTGSWQPGSPIAPGPDARSPAALFRLTLGAINHRLASRGTAFARLAGPGQDALLTALQTGSPDFLGIPTQAFFALLLAMTMEAFFSHPLYGARRDRIAWRLDGFPGAYAAGR